MNYQAVLGCKKTNGINPRSAIRQQQQQRVEIQVVVAMQHNNTLGGSCICIGCLLDGQIS
jgi:hypothetical protein